MTATTNGKPKADRAEIRRALSVLFEPGDVVELRAPKAGRLRTASGYFDDLDRLADAAVEVNRQSGGVYVTMNPVEPALLARRANRWEGYASETTNDTQVPRRRWLLIDADAKRPAGISSTDEEHTAAVERLRQVRTHLVEDHGWPEPVAADSGNGGHLLFRVDLPGDDDGLLQRVLAALDERFSDELVSIDTTVANPGRIVKLYGTVAGKGDHTQDRPHRLAKLLHVPGEIGVLPREKLEALAGPAPEPPPRSTGRAQQFGEKLDVDRYLADRGVAVHYSKDYSCKTGRGRKWVLKECVWCGESDKSAFVIQFDSGALSAGCQHDRCTGRGWHDFRDAVEPGWRERRAERPRYTEPIQGAEVTPADSWPDPLPLPSELSDVMAFNFAMLPRTLRGWVADIAERIQCPPDYPGITAMIVLAGIVGRKVGIRPKRYDDWTVVPNLWGMCIGRPGLMKTPAMQEPLKVLKRLEIEAKAEFDAAAQEHEANAIIDKQRRQVAERDIREAIKKGGDARAIALDLLGDNGRAPRRRRYLINDSTVEKLGELLNDNPNGLAVYRDELVGLLRGLDKEGQEGSRAFYLEAWNGSGRFTYDRIGRGTLDVEAVTLSIIGAIQPGPLSDYLAGAVRGGVGDDGLLQRFQLAVWPDCPTAWRNVDRWPDSQAKATAWDMLRETDRMAPADFGAQFEEGEDIPFLRFDTEAQRIFDSWRESLELRLRSGTEHPAIESHLAKFRSLIPSLALLIHLADEPFVSNVSASPLEAAIFWGRYLESHARRVYGVAINRQRSAAKALAEKLLDGTLAHPFALRDVYRPGWSGLVDRDDAIDAVDVLVRLNWLRETTQETGGKPKRVFHVNPKKLQTPYGEELTILTNPPDSGPFVSNVSASPRGSQSFSSDEADPNGILAEAAEGVA